METGKPNVGAVTVCSDSGSSDVVVVMVNVVIIVAVVLRVP